jgi:hypothetical protein
VKDPHAPWRYTLMSGLFPALPLILIRPFLPESPAWAARRAARSGLGGPLASPSADGGLEELAELARSRAWSSTRCASSWPMRAWRVAMIASLATISARSRAMVAAAAGSGAPGAGSPGTPTLTVSPPSWSAVPARGRRRLAPRQAAGQPSHGAREPARTGRQGDGHRRRCSSGATTDDDVAPAHTARSGAPARASWAHSGPR